MTDKLDRLLADAAATPLAEPDVLGIYRRARRQRRQQWAARAAAAAVVLTILALGVPLTLQPNEIGFIAPSGPRMPSPEGLPTIVATPDRMIVPPEPQPPAVVPPVDTPTAADWPDPTPQRPWRTPSQRPPEGAPATTAPDRTDQPPSSSPEHAPYLAIEGTVARSPVRAGDRLIVRYGNTGSVPVQYGASYRYERYEAGTWVPAEQACPTPPCAWPGMGYTLEPGESRDFEADTSGLLLGRHRILKYFFDGSDAARGQYGDRQSVEIAVEFHIAM
jgi:hypothetical protein